ncbi:hypothetical protein [Amaricoccus sp.]|uniref:hypothetical protein n=1 Tax=Amaricoccus sp. TaxID=1872485 RepID=UPI001B579C6E|nr:hypothetical protein [Amaricoccus sp.]MBP7003631.1 BatD family protein [Amaricoccus sp.]
MLIRATLLALALAGPAAAESLTLSFVPHPAHGGVVAGEMVPVTLRAVYDRKIALEDLTIAPSDSFDWVQTAPDHWKEELIDGKSWIVMERELAIVPKRPGLLHFGPATHELTIIDETSRRQERVVTAPPLTLSVGAFPGAVAGDAVAVGAGPAQDGHGWRWVAEKATLTQELSTDPSRLQDGETVIRRVTLRALGALPEALPPRPVVSEPWLITFAAPVERRLVLTTDGPVAEAVWTWQFRPETGEPGVIPPVTIPYFNAATRRMDALEIPPLPIGYASFYSNQVQTGRFDAAARLAGAASLLAGLGAGAAITLARGTPDATRDGLRRLLRRWSPLLRLRMRRAARDGDLLTLRRLLAATRPDATEAAALLDRAIYRPGAAFDPAAFRRALR